MAPSKYTDLVLDLGGVLFSFAPTKEMSLSSRTIKHGFHSSYWHDYERGKISQEQCYDSITKEYDLAPGAWGETIDKLEATLKPIQGFLDAIKHIKTIFPHLRIHGFSNISGPDYEKLRPTVDGWAIFDSVTTSASLGHRKPDLDSYRKLQEITNIDAHTSIFVDDTPENVMNAQSLGFYGIRFQDADNVVIQLHNLLGDPVARGMEYLRQNSKDLFCESDSGVIVKDNLSQLLILQCIGDRDMVVLENEGDCWPFFIGKPVFTDEQYPKDSDTTALALVVLEASDSQKQVAMDTILEYQTPDGLTQIYFDHARPRWCPHICASVLRLFYLNGQGHRVRAMLEHFCRLLSTKADECDTRYYFQADWMFYHLADLCDKSSDPELGELRTLLTKRLQERMGCDKDVMGAAMRVLAAQSLKLTNPRDLKTLLTTQQLDGSWGLIWMWTYGHVSVKIGSRGIPAAMAVKAIRTASEIEGSK